MGRQTRRWQPRRISPGDVSRGHGHGSLDLEGPLSRDVDEDGLIARLRDRAADPARRVDERPTVFSSSVQGAGLGALQAMGRSVSQDLRRLVEHGVDDALAARAESFGRDMATPAESPLPSPATPEQLVAAEARLGVRLPAFLGRLYREVANGGFGPGPGIVGVAGGWTTTHGASHEDLTAELRDPDPEHPSWIWPSGLLPMLDHGGVFPCVDAASAVGRIVEWDPEELDPRGRGDGGWTRSFREVAPALTIWLADWLQRPSPAEAMDAQLAAVMSTVPEVSRVHWASMTPEQRAEFGLPETGWGRALFGDAWGDDPRDGSGSS